jgi:hypothetical protein
VASDQISDGDSLLLACVTVAYGHRLVLKGLMIDGQAVWHTNLVCACVPTPN